MKNKNSVSEKSNLKLKLQEKHNISLSDDRIESQVQMNYAKISNYLEFIVLTNNSKAFLVIITEEESIFATQTIVIPLRMEDEIMLHENGF